jgi:translation initiation factor 1 (eIF-1/SUI1)
MSNNLSIELTSSIDTTGEVPKVIISAPGYESIEKIPYKGDGTAKEDLGVIQLNPIQDGLELDKLKSSQLDTKQIEEISSSKKDFKYFSQKKLTDLIGNLKSTLIPLVLTLIAQFGITKVSKLIANGKTKADDVKDQISCPTPEELSKIISRKNKTVKQLNNALKIIDNTTKALGITEGILILLDATLFTADNTPSFINPLPPGINKILSKTIDGLKATNAGLLVVLVLLRQVLTQAVQYLSLLDSLVQHCSPGTPQEQISGELIRLTQQQATQSSPVVTVVNGFTMGVETEVTDKPLKRRRAIATNKNGVVMLQGDWSFSSVDQILIDELVFYIQQNNLKAD